MIDRIIKIMKSFTFHCSLQVVPLTLDPFFQVLIFIPVSVPFPPNSDSLPRTEELQIAKVG